MHPSHSRREAGFTFAELAFGLLILVICAALLINHLTLNYQTTQSERDRVFAYTKAQGVLSEIQSYVDRGGIEAVELDTLDDGVVNKPTLSIQTDALGALVPPDHVISGNMQRAGQWLWSRRITVQPFAGSGNRNVRYVTVRIYRRDLHGNERSLADLSAVVNTSGQAYPSTQVYDLYLFAIENIPGWWVYMDSIRPFMESMITDLETRNPGLEFRTHWITKASFGRNQAYRPYTNNVADSNAVVPDVYHYPGRMPTGSASAFYYVPDNIKARINVEGTERNGYDSDLNPHPYALADFFNHAMRYPDELALWQTRVAAVEAREAAIAAAIAAASPPPPELADMSKEPTLRLFLEDLYSDPDKYKNAMVVNLHGELLPMPALRNFSDPAKSQVAHPNLRVVTHPEELRTKNDDAGTSDSLVLRMYAFGYQTSANHYLSPPSGPSPSPIMEDPMVVEIVGLDLLDPDPSNANKLRPGCTLANVPGGVTVGGSADYSATWLAAKHATDGPVAGEMYYTALYVPPSGSSPGFTRVLLFNTPVGAPPVVQGGLTHGLAATERARLYQMEYIPCPVSTAIGTPSFTPDLTSVGVGPKNTARWTLRLAPSVLTDNSVTGDFVVQVRTRIATDYATGTAWQSSGSVFPTVDDPDNLSVTYAWWTDSSEDVPFTERAQFQGDPRHLPYKDCFNGSDDFPNSFSCYLDDLYNPAAEPAISDFPCLQIAAGAPPTSRLRDGWGGGAMACDVPRYMQILRQGLVRSRCVYSSLTGWSYYYLGVGNDIGYDAANGYPSSIPSDLTAHGAPGSSGYLDTILGARRYVRSPGALGTDYWWGMPWLGELAPDSQVAAQWTAGSTPRGNLTAGTGTDQFYQATCNSTYAGSLRQAYGTAIRDNIQRTASYGCTTLFNIGSSASTFQHSASGTNGTLTAKGAEISGNYNMTAPVSAPVSRPFRLNVNTAVAEHWNFAPYTTRYSASLFETYYTHAAGVGSAVVKLVDPTNTDAAYVVVNGIANTVTNGTPFIAQWNLLTLVHTLLEAGSTTNTLRIQEQPRVEIASPTDITELVDPATIAVQYGIEWARWDGLPYTATGTFGESEMELEYAIVYSRDGGATWLHVQDGSSAEPGVRPAAAYLVADVGVGNESYDWDVSVSFPEGSYLLRVDCFRSGASVHYAYHQTRLFIQR